jgi:hypothetical protein
LVCTDILAIGRIEITPKKDKNQDLKRLYLRQEKKYTRIGIVNTGSKRKESIC